MRILSPDNNFETKEVTSGANESVSFILKSGKITKFQITSWSKVTWKNNEMKLRGDVGSLHVSL